MTTRRDRELAGHPPRCRPARDPREHREEHHNAPRRDAVHGGPAVRRHERAAQSRRVSPVFWTAETSRDWGADYRRGQAYGRQALEAIAKDRFPGLLINIVAEMMKRRKYDIIMIGFFQALGDAFVPPDRPTH